MSNVIDANGRSPPHRQQRRGLGDDLLASRQPHLHGPPAGTHYNLLSDRPCGTPSSSTSSGRQRRPVAVPRWHDPDSWHRTPEVAEQPEPAMELRLQLSGHHDPVSVGSADARLPGAGPVLRPRPHRRINVNRAARPVGSGCPSRTASGPDACISPRRSRS